jgi:hypothetical protein
MKETTMSFTITARAVPAVAAAPWNVVDAHLSAPSGDWTVLRRGLLHLVCDRVTRDGDPVSRAEEALLGRLYTNLPTPRSFLDALAAVRAEIAAWPAGTPSLLERFLATDPSFPTGGTVRTHELTATSGVSDAGAFVRLLAAVTDPTPPPAPVRTISRFLRTIPAGGLP